MRARLVIRGRVQRVFFRETMRTRASAAKVQGWVRNLPDGTVEALLQGPAAAVEGLISWAHEGPPRAVVERVEYRWEEPGMLEEEFRILS